MQSPPPSDAIPTQCPRLPSLPLLLPAVPPKVNLNIESKARHVRKKMAGDKRGTGHSFSAANPLGTKSKGDKRQFARI